MPRVPRKRWNSSVKTILPRRHWPMQPSLSQTTILGTPPNVRKHARLPTRRRAPPGWDHPRPHEARETHARGDHPELGGSGRSRVGCRAGCHRSNWASSPGRNRSADTVRRQKSGRSSATRSLRTGDRRPVDALGDHRGRHGGQSLSSSRISGLDRIDHRALGLVVDEAGGSSRRAVRTVFRPRRAGGRWS